MKAISEALRQHYAQETTTLATLTYCKRKDGRVFAFTDHPEPITFATQTDFIDPDVIEDVTYLPTSSYDAGAIQTSSSMGVDDVTLTGIQSPSGVTAQDIEAGLWDACKVQIMEVNYRDLTMGCNLLRFGELGEIGREGKKFTTEFRGLMQYLQNTVGRVVLASCDADLGDTRCGVDLEPMRVSGTVADVVSQREFTADAMSAGADYFTFGKLTWDAPIAGGDNAGLSMEVKSYTDGGGFVLQIDMPYPIQVGDTFMVTPGCNKIGRGGLSSTSTTSLAIGVGTKAFTAIAGLTYTPGVRVRATSSGSSEWMQGTVVSYSGSTLTLFIDSTSGGSATHADWALSGGGVKSGDCMVKFNNYNRFRGYEDLPGQNKILLVGGS